MGYYLHGIELSDGPAMSKLTQETSVNVAEYPVYGSDSVEIQIVSVSSRDMKISIPIRKEDVGDSEQVEYVVDNLNGLMARLSPLHIRSDDVAIYGSSRDVFVVLKNMSVDWQAGTAAANLMAIVNLDCIVIGTPESVFGVFPVKSQMRNGDYVGVIAGRSTIGLPYNAPGFLVNVNQQILETRNNTKMLDLGDTTYGFCDDTTGQDAEAVDIGEVRFNIDTDSLNFLVNAVKVYDEGFTPRKRVLSRYHEFTGNLVIETELYRVVMDKTVGSVALHNYVGPGYSGSPFETLMFTGMSGYNVVLNKDEIVRVHLNTGDYFEIERGKDPVINLAELNAPTGFNFTIAASMTGSTTPTVNYVQLTGTNTYICSNYEFDITTQNVKTALPGSPPIDQVFSIVYYTGTFSTSGRNREVLKEIS